MIGTWLKNIFSSLTSGYPTTKQQYITDILSGITVAFALIPESIAFAFVAGVSPLISLQTAIVIGFVAVLITGRPGMISSSTAGMAIVVAPLVASHGVEYLFAAVILIGLIQSLFGLFKIGKYASIIPHSVVLGLLNGLAILIFIAQFEQFKIGDQWLPTTDFAIMGVFIAATMAIIHRFPRITKKIPSSLVGIGIITIISLLLDNTGIYSLQTVENFAGMPLVGSFPTFHIPQVPWTLETLGVIFPYALIAALVGLTEATLTLKVIDDMTNTKGRMNREYWAQSIANFINGLFGGMGGDAMIGQSIINIKSGGRTKISGLVASIGLLVFILFAAPLVNNIPLAALVGLMFMVVIGTFERETLRYKGKVPYEDLFIILIVMIITIVQDLATAMIIGVLLSTLMFARKKGKALTITTTQETRPNDAESTLTVYHINGLLFFGSVESLKEKLDPEIDASDVILDLTDAKVMDLSAIQCINLIGQKYTDQNKQLLVRNPGTQCRLLMNSAKDITSITLAE